jgi:hypothetical protein
MSLEDDGVLAFQITVPSQIQTPIERFHSFRAGGPFLNTEAVYREAITTSSPYYKLLLAFRGFEGVQQTRRMLRKTAEDLGVSEKIPKPLRLETLHLARLQFPPEVRALKGASELFA